MDLTKPEEIDVSELKDFIEKHPGVVKAFGELNVMKNVLVHNENQQNHVTSENVEQWSSMMALAKSLNFPIGLHCDLDQVSADLTHMDGSFGRADSLDTERVYVMEKILETYPENVIVWMHMAGVSKEVIENRLGQWHCHAVDRLLKKHSNLYIDLAWDVLAEKIWSVEDLRKQ